MTLVQTEPKKIYIWWVSRLPAEYQEVEYIESSWTQWIDTWLNAWIWYRINMKIYTSSNSIADQTVIWWNANTNTEAIYCWLNYSSSYNSIYRWYNSQWFDANNTIAVWNTYEIESIIRNWTQKLTVNWTVKFTWSLSLSWTWTNHMAIFSRRWSNYALIKLYSMQIYNSSDTLVRNFVPCYRKQDAVIWLYDLVNNQFYINSWTWTFTKWANIGGEKEIKKIVVFPDGVTEKQIRPVWWKPWVNTIAYYPLNSTYTNKDQSWNNRNGTTTWTLTYSDNYCQFTSGNYISIPTSIPYGTNPFTLSIWFNSPNVSWHQNWFYNQFHSRTNDSAIWLFVNAGQLGFWSKWNNDRNNITSISANTWYNAIITYNWSTLTCYVNWIQVGTKTRTISTTTPNYSWIGRWSELNGTVYCIAKLSNYIIENTVRTAQEVANYYNLTKWNYWL